MAYTTNVMGPLQQAPDWTTPYKQWSPEQQQQATSWLTPQIQSGNYGKIYDTAQSLGVNSDSLAQAMNATGWTRDAAEWGRMLQNSLGRSNAWTDPNVQYMQQNTPAWTQNDINAYTRNNGLNPLPYADPATIQRQQEMRAKLIQNSKALFGQSIGNQSVDQYLKNLGVNSKFGSTLLKGYDPNSSLADQIAQIQQTMQNKYTGMSQPRGMNAQAPSLLSRMGSKPLQKKFGGYGGIVNPQGSPVNISPEIIAQFLSKVGG